MVYGYINTDSGLPLDKQLSLLSGCGSLVCEPSERYGKTTLEVRPIGLDKLLSELKEGDTVKVASLEVLPLTLLQTIETVAEQCQKGVSVISVMEPKAEPSLLFDLSRIQYRKKARSSNLSLANARARGRNGGRKAGLSEKAKKTAKSAANLYQSGQPIADIMETLKIGSKATLYRYLRHEGIEIK
jgi:DNA invertase Pin-like site-specific DNA recombinase